MKIIKARIIDLNEIAKVELGSGYHKTKFNPIPMLKQIFLDKRESIFIVKENRNTIGYIAIRTEKLICEIALLAILKDHQRRGIASKLIKYIINISNHDKLSKIILEVRNNNLNALDLYLKFGFVVIGIRKVNQIIKLKMEKKLR